MADEVDLDALLAHRGGVSGACKQLAGYAVEVINRYSCRDGNWGAVRGVDPNDVVNHAFERILTDWKDWPNGEDLFKQLRRHVQNYIHVLAKSKLQQRFVQPGDGDPETSESDIPEIDYFADANALDPAEAAEVTDDEETSRRFLDHLRTVFPSGSIETRLIDLLIEGWRDRKEASELLEIKPEEYDKVFKRVQRSAIKHRANFMQTKAAT